MKQLNIIFLILLSFATIQCAKYSNKAPSRVELIYPSENLLCIDNRIDFNWSDAIDPEDDEIEYSFILATDRALTNVVEDRTINASEITLNLEKGIAYYWKVDALDVVNNLGTSSEIFAFYTKGNIDNYAPFISKLVTPENNSAVNAGTVFLSWIAEDINTTDILTYELYFGENGNLTLINDALASKNYEITVDSGKTYSWKVNVKDQNGAKSIGETWSFTVN